MKIAVCVKYVPVVAQMGFDYATKTMLREGVPSEINPFDRLGLLCATGLTAGPADEVLAVSMGPPQAREGLLHCLALGADRAVLLTDCALAGSDTFATARALALLLAREQPDLILCGRNSTDAETGQVRPELAELLGLPHLSQVRRLTYEAAAGREDRRRAPGDAAEEGAPREREPCHASVRTAHARLLYLVSRRWPVRVSRQRHCAPRRLHEKRGVSPVSAPALHCHIDPGCIIGGYRCQWVRLHLL